MDAIIPIAILTGVISFGFSNANTKTEVIQHQEIKNLDEKNIDFENYMKRNAEKPVLTERRSKEPFLNTTIINNPGFKPDVSNLYFFKNYYQLGVKKYKIEKNNVITEATINLTVDSPKIINYRDGYQFDYDRGEYFDGIIIRAQLLPISEDEKQFRLVYEIESTESEIKKSSFAERSGNNVLDQLVNEEVKTKEDYQVISKGYHVYTQRIYSLDEKIINIDKPIYIDVGPYRIEMKLLKGKKSELFYDAKNIDCKNKICNLMKSNTIKKS